MHCVVGMMFCFVSAVAQVEFGLVLQVEEKRKAVEMCTGW